MLVSATSSFDVSLRPGETRNPSKGSAQGRENEVIEGGVEALTVLWPIRSLLVTMTVNKDKCIVKMLLRRPNSLQRFGF